MNNINQIKHIYFYITERMLRNEVEIDIKGDYLDVTRNHGTCRIEGIIKDFLGILDQADVLHWKEEYKPDMLYMDCESWKIDITFNDGTHKVSSGENAFPDTFDLLENFINETLYVCDLID